MRTPTRAESATDEMTALDAPAGRPEQAEPDVRPDVGTTELPMQSDERGRSARFLRYRRELPYAWPLWALLMLYPMWWLLGLGTFIFPLAAVPMAIYLVRRCRPIKVPPGFGIWLLFLAWFCASVIMLRVNPPGTVGDAGAMRWAAVGLRLTLYLSITVILLYAGNLTERQLPRTTLVRWLSVMFVITVGGGLLGMLWPSFGFTSPVELVLPNQFRANEYVQSLVHPNSAQIQEILGDPAPRPAAPFGYTNVWGENLSITLIWFVIAWWIYGTGLKKVATVALIGLAMVPAIYSLNRGMWLGVAFSIVFIAVRLALRGRLWLVGGLAVGLTGATLVFMFSPLYSTFQERLANGHSNRVREFTTEKVIEVTKHSPIIGLGNTRDAAGSARSIAVGKTAECPECRNPALGMNGHIWLVLISQGFVGAALYMLFFLYGILRYWRDVTPIGLGGILILVLSLTYNFYYDASVTSLAFFMLAYALLWRNDIEHARVARRVALRPRNRRRFIGRATARTQGTA